MNEQARAKDPMTVFRSVIRGKNSKGGDRFQLYLTQEEAQALVNTITASNTSERGVKLDLHISKKEYEGRTFDSAIAFVKTVQETVAGRTSARFVPKSNGAAAAAAAQIKGQKIA